MITRKQMLAIIAEENEEQRETMLAALPQKDLEKLLKEAEKLREEGAKILEKRKKLYK